MVMLWCTKYNFRHLSYWMKNKKNLSFFIDDLLPSKKECGMSKFLCLPSSPISLGIRNIFHVLILFPHKLQISVASEQFIYICWHCQWCATNVNKTLCFQHTTHTPAHTHQFVHYAIVFTFAFSHRGGLIRFWYVRKNISNGKMFFTFIIFCSTCLV